MNTPMNTPANTPLTPHDPASIPANPPQRALGLHRELDRVWRNAPGLRGQITAVSHTTLGLRFMVTAFLFFGIGGLLAMLIRAQLATPNGAFLDTALYNQIFTMHGSIMMFLFAIPMLEGLAMYLLPKMLGTRDLAFPRLSALGYWCYLLGGLILIAALLAGVAPGEGWFMYTPLSGKTYSPGINADVWLLGVTFVEISALSAAIELMVSILRLRAPGMKLTQMPLFAWYMLGTAAMMLAGFPPLILGSVLLEMERAFGWPFFDPERGGDPLLWQHLFWLFGHPEVYIIFLPAAGVLSTVIPVLCRTQIVGYGAIVAAILGMVFLSFGLWVHHMFAVGIPHLALAFFSAASMLVAVPTAVQIFAWIATLWRGRPELKLPMLYILGFFFTFVMGGLTGVMLAVVPFNWQAHDTAFVTAHLHYVLIGGFVFPMLAGVAWWMPLMSGRRRVRGLGEAAFWFILVGFHGTFFLMHLTGLMGMARRIPSYPENPEWTALNLSSSFFGFVMTIGFALFAIDLILQAGFGKRSVRNPWKAPSLDWAMALPPPNYNFASLPGPALQQAGAEAAMLALAKGEGLLPGAPRGRREILVTSVGTARPEHVAILPVNTGLPLLLALAISAFVLLMLAGLYTLAPLALIPVVTLIWIWARRAMAPLDATPIEVAPGLVLPVQPGDGGTLTRSGLVSLLFANGTFFASLLFGLAFISLVSPGPPRPLWPADRTVLLATGAVLALLAMAALGLPRALSHIETGRRAGAGLPVAFAANLLALALLLALGLGQLPDPTRHAADAVRAALVAYVGLHAAIATLFTAFALDQARRGELAPGRAGALRNAGLWQSYTLAAAAVTLAALWAQEAAS
ncbi:cytochrome c oxidase subunit I [Ancylobacter polymorphus]|uniref:cytochrome-c oxidase n=1 Tax=Ancylobacter polymorphus TaxID=223390 RepID=A0ABU0BC36_9HYPH|nr:cytochrome c oxidase subunit I [Ancylobacter polymorphus]MDQ0302965.1 cytochrome c oxidase subunit I+III [Ancylobacter polymorphus]